MKLIQSTKNPELKQLRLLFEKARERKKKKLFVIEGEREIKKAILSDYSFTQVFMEDGRQKLSTFLGETYLKLTPTAQQDDAKLAKMLRRPLLASAIIAVCMKRQESEKILEIEEIEAVACAVQNMQLTATAYGIGSFWSSPKIIYTDLMNQYLELENKDKCLGLIYFGYSKEEWPKSHRKPLEYNTTWKTQ